MRLKSFQSAIAFIAAICAALVLNGCGGGGGGGTTATTKSAIVIGKMADADRREGGRPESSRSRPVTRSTSTSSPIRPSRPRSARMARSRCAACPKAASRSSSPRRAPRSGRSTFREVAANQQITITVQLDGGEVVLVDEDRRGIGNAGVELEGPVQNVVVLDAGGRQPLRHRRPRSGGAPGRDGHPRGHHAQDRRGRHGRQAGPREGDHGRGQHRRPGLRDQAAESRHGRRLPRAAPRRSRYATSRRATRARRRRSASARARGSRTRGTATRKAPARRPRPDWVAGPTCVQGAFGRPFHGCAGCRKGQRPRSEPDLGIAAGSRDVVHRERHRQEHQGPQRAGHEHEEEAQLVHLAASRSPR